MIKLYEFDFKESCNSVKPNYQSCHIGLKNYKYSPMNYKTNCTIFIVTHTA